MRDVGSIDRITNLGDCVSRILPGADFDGVNLHLCDVSDS
jgi:hypothetical protein